MDDYKAPNLNQQVADAQRAKEIMEDEVFITALESLRATIMQAWISTAPTQEKEREYLWMQIRAADDLKRNLHVAMETGQLAAGTLEEQKRGLLDRFRK